MIRSLIVFGLLAALLSKLSAPTTPANDQLVRLPNVEYSQPNGSPLHFDFVRPQGDGPFPLVVCIHGGGWRAGSRADYRDVQTNLALQGLASLSVEYRLTPHAQFPAQLDDVLGALTFALADRERFPVDPARIIWLGGSAGGHLALLAGFKKSEAYQSRLIVSLAGPTDLQHFHSLPSGDAALKQASNRDSSDLIADLLGTSDRSAQVYVDASPINQARADSPRVVTIHGKDDDIVPVSQAEALHARLRELGVPEKLILAPGGHDLGGWTAEERNRALLEIAQELQAAVAQPAAP